MDNNITKTRVHELLLEGTRAQFRGILAILLLALSASGLSSESVTLSTYYPAPSGVYTQMITTGNAFLAENSGGSVGIGTSSPASKLDVEGSGGVLLNAGNVGIGTVSPAAALDVEGTGSVVLNAGNVSIGNTSQPSALSVSGSLQLGIDSNCTSAKEGALVWQPAVPHGPNTLLVCASGHWTPPPSGNMLAVYGTNMRCPGDIFTLICGNMPGYSANYNYCQTVSSLVYYYAVGVSWVRGAGYQVPPQAASSWVTLQMDALCTNGAPYYSP